MAEKIPVKGNEGYFLQVDKIFFELLKCTDLNIYGILILAQVYEFKRNKKPCMLSTQSFCDLFKTSSYTIEKQLNILCDDLKLLKKTIRTNRKNTISRVRELSIPQNFAKVFEKITQNPSSKQPQNFGVPSDKQPLNFGVALDQKNIKNQPSNLRVPSGTSPKNLGLVQPSEATLNFDDNQPSNSSRSNPQILGYNNIIHPDRLNNKLLEDISSSPTSLNSDDHNDSPGGVVVRDFDVASTQFNVASNYTQNDVTHDENDVASNSILGEDEMGRKPNQTYEMMKAYYQTINPIARYEYEHNRNLKNIALYEAWGNKGKVDRDRSDYYTDDEIIEYFKKENNLQYLRDIGWQAGDSWLTQLYQL